MNIEDLYKCFESNRMHPCWMFIGDKSVQKIALDFAIKILTFNKANQNIIERQIRAQSYPNYFYLNHEETISIEDVRKAQSFLYKAPAISGWRVVIIDCVDKLSRFSANALLKIIEEPPRQTLMIGICHKLGTIIPTLRSRFQKLFLPKSTTETEITDTMKLLNFNIEDLKKSCVTIAKNEDLFKALDMQFRKIAYHISINNPYSELLHDKISEFIQYLNDSANAHLDKANWIMSCVIRIKRCINANSIGESPL